MRRLVLPGLVALALGLAHALGVAEAARPSLLRPGGSPAPPHTSLLGAHVGARLHQLLTKFPAQHLLLDRIVPVPLAVSDCPMNPNVGVRGLVPLTDGDYRGVAGGLYPDGNSRPSLHDAAGRAIAQRLTPLNASGQPDPAGQIVVMPVGISLTEMVWDGKSNGDPSFAGGVSLMGRVAADPQRNPRLRLVEGIPAQTGYYDWTDPTSQFWPDLQGLVQSQGVPPAQVQVAWVYVPNGAPADALDFPADAQWVQQGWVRTLQNLHRYFPNVRLAYTGTKHFTYRSPSDPTYTMGGPWDPWAHDGAWGLKWALAQQINGDPALNYDPGRGPVQAPWAAWGPYYWSDDGQPRAYDDFHWDCEDVGADGSHPSPAGVAKEAGLLFDFFRNDPTAAPWYFGGAARDP